MSEQFRGWWWSPNSRKAHYFDNDVRSLCGNFLVLAPAVLHLEVQDTDHNSPDNCAGCKRKVLARLEKERGKV